jgi:hypothetical protein
MTPKQKISKETKRAVIRDMKAKGNPKGGGMLCLGGTGGGTLQASATGQPKPRFDALGT